jgi:acyl carrier protein
MAAREIVSDMLRGRVSAPIEDEQALISSGLIDSLSVLTLISRMEKKLGIRVATSGLQPDDFEHIDLIVETIERSTV